LQKVLETANIKLSSVGSLVMGKSGQRMVAAMIEGISDPEALAELARGTLRRKLPQLQQALNGQIEAHHRVLLGRIFAHMSFLEDSIQHLQLEIDQRLSPFTEAMQLRLAHPWHSGDYGRGDSGGNRRGNESLSLGQALRRLEALGYTVTLTPKQEEVS
jgi:hypothetical protein